MAGVITDSPAQEAGLAEGDTITSVNGHAVDSPTALSSLLSALQAGRQGDHRLDRRLGRDAHRLRDAVIRPPAISGDYRTVHSSAPVTSLTFFLVTLSMAP